MNPHVSVTVHPQPETLPIDVAAIESITVACPLRGRGLTVRELHRGDALFPFFTGLVASDGRLELASDDAALPGLRELGFLVTAGEVVEWPRFRIPLENGVAPRGPYLVRGSLLFQPDFDLHPALVWPDEYRRQAGGLACFAKGPACWVGDPTRELATPFWLDDATAQTVSQLLPGTVPPTLSADLESTLASAGILIPAKAPPASDAAHRQAFRARKVAVVLGLLHPSETRALRNYGTALLGGGLLAFGDRQVARRFGRYNEPVSRFVHTRLTAFMSELVGRPVHPSFSYLFSYEEGAELTPHADRREAQYSISLQLDYTPAPPGPTGWPLGFHFADGSTFEADLRIGDAAIYHGEELVHHRRPLPAGHRSTHLILEYVAEYFAGPRI